MARLEEAMMYQEPETVYRTAQRQTMTSYAPPLFRRVDSDRRTPLGWLGAISEVAGFALLECLASPVVAIAALVVSFLIAIEALSDLCRSWVNILDGRTRKAQK